MQEHGVGRIAVYAGVAAAYFLIAFEILFMILPFAVYFYSVYAPILEFLSSNPVTGWSTEFFLPHMVFTRDPVIVGISYLQVLFIIGLVMFLFAAIPLYYTKIFKRHMAARGLYSYIRHPQYLALGVSGFGLLLYWPRFIILIFYVTMLFVYYLLARNEEWRMKRQFGISYMEYMNTTPMFLPGEPGGKIYRATFGRISPGWLGLTVFYAVTLIFFIASALWLRAYSANHIPIFSAGEMTVIPAFERPEAEVRRVYRTALSNRRVQKAFDSDMNLVYILPGDFFLTAILTEEPRKFSEDIIELFPEVLEWHQHKFGGTIGDFFKIFYNFIGTQGARETDYDVERLIFVSAKTRKGKTVGQKEVLDIGLVRSAALLVDIDADTRKVLAVKKLTGLHKWGTIPMPVF